jgi:ABC-type sugar transport system ATPase subunit
MSDDERLVLSVSNLSKAFVGQQALDAVSFDLRPGEIHALVGENGCGKSTFIKCLAGYHQPSPGAEIRIAGELLPLPYTPHAALGYGLSFVHQNLGLVPTLSVAENLALSRAFKTGPGWRIDWRGERRAAREALALFGDHIHPNDKVGNLSQADKTLVAIARGLQGSAETRRVLVLDEPTAALPAHEVDRLFEALRAIAAQGVGIIYVSHRLSEILSLADRVTVFRDGKRVATELVPGLSERQLVTLIIGRSLEAYYPEVKATASEEVLLRVNGLSGNRVRDVSFEMRHGEIVGIAGLLGSGRSELGRLLFGAQPRTAGIVKLDDRDVDYHSPHDAIRGGVGLVPQDRLGQGAVGTMTVGENITLADLSDFWRGGVLNKNRERKAVEDIVRTYNVRPNDAGMRMNNLSGGNQQKAIIAKFLRLEPRLLILDEPVQGVDIGSKTEIYDLIERAAASGTGVLLIDSDFEDLSRLCDRVLIMRQGQIVGELAGADCSSDRINEKIYLSDEAAA